MDKSLRNGFLKSSKGVWYSIPGEAVNGLKVPSGENELFEDGEAFKYVASLIDRLLCKKEVSLIGFDGFLGVDWSNITNRLNDELVSKAINTLFVDFSSCFKEKDEIEEMLNPYLTIDPEWGRVYRGRPDDLLDATRLKELKTQFKNLKEKSSLKQLTVCFGCFSAIPYLRKLYDMIFYVDMTIEEFFRRWREDGLIYALGSKNDSPIYLDQKRFYYVDYVLLRKHKKYLLRYIDWYIIDEGDHYKMMASDLLSRVCSALAKRPFRPKPFYIPGVWGGEWLKALKPGLRKLLPSPDIPISWEIDVLDIWQSVRVSISRSVLEIPLLTILWKEGRNILGEYVHKKYRGRLPLTMSYDDTYNSGSLAKGEGLAIQVHPHRNYLKRHFNELYGHHESYYVLDTGSGAKTYQGLRENADIDEFYRDVVRAVKYGIPFDHNKYVDSFPSRRGDLFLNPAGTIHASGYNQVVIEPDLVPLEYPGYIFHFYDYLRLDLDGKPRGIHPDHAFRVLKKNRRTNWVVKNLQLKPRLIRKGDGWCEYLIGECKEAEYRMHRLEFIERVEDKTDGAVQLLTLVDGVSVLIKSGDEEFKLNFGETVIIPSSLGRYSIICLNCGDGNIRTPAGTSLGPVCKVLKFFVKPIVKREG
ncbi:MAG: class I mannose-6-phosphate isomerase [Candidatus Bathyarchaeia archaeon]